jgi:predicted Zn finger-like uncharacterized protein
MNVTCPECASTYRVDPLKVPVGGVRARCANCPAEFLVSVDSVVPAFTTEAAATIESGTSPVEEAADTWGSSHAAYEESPAYDSDPDDVVSTQETPDPDASVDTFADSFSTFYAEELEEDEEPTEVVGAGNSDLSLGRVTVHFDVGEDAEEGEGDGESDGDETVASMESSASHELPTEEEDSAGELGISVTVEGATSWDVVDSESTEVAITGESTEESPVAAETESDDSSGDWSTRVDAEGVAEPAEVDQDLDSDFDSSSVFTRDTFAQEPPATAAEYNPNGSGHSGADGYETDGGDGYGADTRTDGHDSDARTEESVLASEAGDSREEVADEEEADDSATSVGGWEESRPPREAAAEEYDEAVTLEEVEAPAGFAAVQQPRSDADLSLPPAPFGSADPNDRARSLARALVSDIVVYHRDRRDRSIRAGTLRQEFREEIRKSWDEYVTHVGNQVARDTSYFRDALNEVLAGGQQLF